VVKVLVGAALVVGVAVPAVASFSGTDVFIPSVGRGPGLAGSNWYSCIWVYNPGSTAVNVTYSLLERDQPNPTPAQVFDTIPAGSTYRLDNVVENLFGVSNKFGALRVVASEKVIVNGRNYSKPAGGEERDTVGQFFSAIPAAFAIGQGQRTQLLGVYQTTPLADAQYRYNFGFVEVTGQGVTVRVTARDAAGGVQATNDYTLGGFEARQYNITDLVAGIDSPNLRLEVEGVSGTGKVVAVGSGLANRSNDPSTFEMSFRDELLAGTGSGLTVVSHDATLNGDGTVGSPLGIAGNAVTTDKLADSSVGPAKIKSPGVATDNLYDGAVTQAKLSTSGTASSGNVLGTDGTNLKWQSAGSGGLTLPWADSASTAAGADAFYVQNTGSGRAIRAASQSDTALWAVSTTGQAVVGWSTSGDGVEGRSSTAGKSGVWGHNTAGNGVTGRSDATDGVVGITTSTAAGAAGVHASNTGGGKDAIAIYSDGDIYATGAFRGNLGPGGGAPFPRPAWDSGWFSLARGETRTLTHGIGGDTDKYVIDMQSRSRGWGSIGLNNLGQGFDSSDDGQTGYIYSGVTASTIDVKRGNDDAVAEFNEYRVRIWVYR
jgi:hypothetical protein